MIGKAPAIVVGILLAAAACFASDTEFERRFTKGVVLAESGENREAVEEFRAALAERPGDFLATLYLGVALGRRGDPDAEPTLRKALAMKPDDARANLEMGIYCFLQERPAEAGSHFDRTIALAPGSDYAASAAEYQKTMRERRARKRWQLNLSAGGQYDTNVVLGANDNPLPAGISRRSDSSFVAHLRGRYGAPLGDNVEGSAGYAVFANFHRELSDFDIVQHLVDLRGSYALSPAAALRASYTFEYVSLGGEEYDTAHAIAPSATIREGPRFSTVVGYRWKDTRYKDAPLFLRNSDRSGSNHLFEVVQNVVLHGAVRARGGWSHDRDAARTDFWRYDGDRFLAGVRVDLPHRSFVDLAADYYRKTYGARDPSYGVERRDNSRGITIQGGYGFTETLGATAGYSFADVSSNIAAFSYRREITSLFLNARF